jgi:hypothetical protein
MNLIPFVSSNLWAAADQPEVPSLIRSESETPWFWYFFATETTKRRFERTSLSSASWSPTRMRRASAPPRPGDEGVRADVAQVLIERPFLVGVLLRNAGDGHGDGGSSCLGAAFAAARPVTLRRATVRGCLRRR